MSKFSRGHTKAAKLNASQVYDIRGRYAEGATQGELAREYGISVVQIGRIVRGESWMEHPRVPHKDEVAASEARFLASLDKPPVEITAEEAQRLADIGTLAQMAEQEQPEVDAVAEFMKRRGKPV